MNYFFVCLGSLHVYADQQKAVKAAMKIKGARFKSFPSRDEAVDFVKGLHCNSSSPEKLQADQLHTSSLGTIINQQDKTESYLDVNM